VPSPAPARPASGNGLQRPHFVHAAHGPVLGRVAVQAHDLFFYLEIGIGALAPGLTRPTSSPSSSLGLAPVSSILSAMCLQRFGGHCPKGSTSVFSGCAYRPVAPEKQLSYDIKLNPQVISRGFPEKSQDLNPLLVPRALSTPMTPQSGSDASEVPLSSATRRRSFEISVIGPDRDAQSNSQGQKFDIVRVALHHSFFGLGNGSFVFRSRNDLHRQGPTARSTKPSARSFSLAKWTAYS
jgi:hypothetical protein